MELLVCLTIFTPALGDAKRHGCEFYYYQVTGCNSWRWGIRDLWNAYESNVEVPRDKVRVKVENGWVTLEGELEWNFQKEAAKDALRNLAGVMGVTNNITIKADTRDKIKQEDIENALERNWTLNDQAIGVKVSGNKVTLTGTVNSLYQKSEAARIAWNARGVVSVENKLVVDYAIE